MTTPDYGHNGRTPEGLWRMHPSGDLVDTAEKDRRLAENAKRRRLRPAENQILGMSWDELECRQGGKLNRDV